MSVDFFGGDAETIGCFSKNSEKWVGGWLERSREHDEKILLNLGGRYTSIHYSIYSFDFSVGLTFFGIKTRRRNKKVKYPKQQPHPQNGTIATALGEVEP